MDDRIEIQEPARLEVRDVALWYERTDGGRLQVIENANFCVRRGEFFVILGPSGCGKSTLLRIIAGLTSPSEGKVLVDGVEVRSPSRDRAMVFQAYTSFPWLTCIGNVVFGLKIMKIDKQEIKRLAAHYLDVVGLSDFANTYPKDLSGGMKQRVAIARTLAVKPKVLLMDEPFGALDAQTRWAMQELILRICRDSKTTVVFVTHDIEEAIFLADRVYVSSALPSQLERMVNVPFEERHLSLKASDEFRLLEAEILNAVRVTCLRQSKKSDNTKNADQ